VNRCGFLILSLVATLLMGSAWVTYGQSAEETASIKSLWVKGFELYEQAEILAGAGESDVASRRFAEALACFEEIGRRQGDWNPSLVKYRIAICRKRMTDMASAAATAVPGEGRAAVAGAVPPADAPLVLAQDLDSITALATENATLKSELAALNQELARLRAKEQSFTDLALQSTRLDGQNRTLRGQVEEAAARREQAERERKNALDAQAGFIQKITELNKSLAEAREQNLALAEAVAQIPALREKAEQCERLTVLVADLNRQQAEAKAELQAKRQLVVDLEKEIPVLREQLAASTQRLEQVEAERKATAEQQSALLPRVADLDKALAEAKEQNLALAEEANKQNLAQAEKAQRQDLAQAEAAALILSLREKAEQSDRLTELAAGLQRQREEARTELEAQRQAIATLEKELAAFREQAAAANPVPAEPTTSERESAPAANADPAAQQPETADSAPAAPAPAGD
jgi:chromosome segregation ATPase